MRLATRNVNSLKVRLPQVLDRLKSYQPDVLFLQETKLEDANFPAQDPRTAGYEVLFSGQKTYNGVSILSRTAAEQVLDWWTAVTGSNNACSPNMPDEWSIVRLDGNNDRVI